MDQYDGVTSDERLEFLLALPRLINASAETRTIVKRTLEVVGQKFQAEAASVFTLSAGDKELKFWAAQGGAASKLESKKISVKDGIVGWVIREKKGVIVSDVRNDPRFYSAVEAEVDMQTRDILCVPLCVRGDEVIGALQIINSKDGFGQDDKSFLERIADVVALAIDNALLVEGLRERNQRLQALERRKDEITTLLMHEFLTPLNIIQNTTDLLTSGTVDGEAMKKMTALLQKNVQRFIRLFQQIKNLNSLAGASFTPTMSEVRLTELVEETIAQFSEILSKRSLELKLAIDDQVSTVICDRELIAVLLRNLVSNAIRFTKNGGQVCIEANRTLGRVGVCIRDNGIGIPKEEHGRIFEKFYEVGDILKHSSGTFEFGSAGLGLGLSIAKEIAGIHNSAIEVESEPGKGSVFRFFLSERAA